MRLRLIPTLAARGILLDASVGGLIGVLTWPVARTAASTGLDSSWIVGLHLAARYGLSFGNDILFTHGPLGFLAYPQPYLAWTSGLALGFVGTIHVLACAWFFHLARDALGWIKAGVLVLAAAFTFPYIAGWTLFGVLVFAASALAVVRRRDHPSGPMLAVGLGTAVGLAALGKLNVAFVSGGVALVGVVATARDPRRSLALYGASAASCFLVLWVATGQHFADLASYIRGAYEVSAGYSDSMGQVDPQTSFVSGVAALATLILAALAWQRSATFPRRDRLVLLLLTSVMVFTSYKAGFTRAGVGMTIYLVTLLALWPAVIPRVASPEATSLAVAGLLGIFLAVASLPVASVADPVGRVSALVHEAATALTGRASAATATRAALRSQYALPAEAIPLIAGRTVDIEPWETALAYAYPEIIWRPEPVFQPYSAYTPFLDERNADLLASPNAPDRILWLTPDSTPLSIDGRSVWFDAPSAKLEMVCRYLPLMATSTWQVLGGVGDRCGVAMGVGTVTTTAGATIPVPRNLPPGILTVRVSGVARDLLSRAVSLAYKAPPWWVREGTSRSRLPLGTAGEAAVLAATTDIGYVGALAVGPPPDTLVIGPDPGAPGDGSPLTVTFQVIPLLAHP